MSYSTSSRSPEFERAMAVTQPFPEEETESTPSSVLIIDDDDLSLRIITKALADNQYHVSTSATAASGVRQAERDQPKLIITNVAMPDTDSADLITALKECAPEACLIVTADYGAEQLAVNALKPHTVVDTDGMKYWQPDADHTKWQSPDMMVKTAVFLACQDARGVTGTVATDREICAWHGIK